MPKTQILTTNDPQALQTAKQIIQKGGLIAFPTDTIYGVAADAFNPSAVKRIFTAKGRSGEKALPILIGDFNQLGDLVINLDERVTRIATAFWPGALTIILAKSHAVPDELSPYPTVGVRMPNLSFTLTLLKETGPLATTSANISDGPNPVNADHVMAQLGRKIDLILDGGPTPGPTASTVVDLTGPEIKILRPGPISLADLTSCIDKDQLNEP